MSMLKEHLFSTLLADKIHKKGLINIPDNQQGFIIKGGRIDASLLSLYPMAEAARWQRRRLYVTYVDVRKAFPSARRELLWQVFSQRGVTDELVRVIWALYHVAQASVRGSESFGLPFPIVDTCGHSRRWR